MAGKTILLCSKDVTLQAAIARSMELWGNQLLGATTSAEALDALEVGSLSLVIVDVTSFDGALALLEEAHGRVPTIAMTAGDDLELLSALICSIGITHVIGRPKDSNSGLIELLITAHKILFDDLFGLEKYLRGSDASLHRAVLTGAAERDSQLEQVSDLLRDHKAPRHLVTTIANAADEMLTNAMYNAPVDRAGRPRYAATNRRSKITLSPLEHVELSYGVHKGGFGIAVRDQFGRLDLEHLSKSIRRCVFSDSPVEQKAGGAGLGLFMIARTAQQFVINVEPGRCTEVIALWSLDRKKLRQTQKCHSLHFFEKAYRLETPRRPGRYAVGTCGPATRRAS